MRSIRLRRQYAKRQGSGGAQDERRIVPSCIADSVFDDGDQSVDFYHLCVKKVGPASAPPELRQPGVQNCAGGSAAAG